MTLTKRVFFIIMFFIVGGSTGVAQEQSPISRTEFLMFMKRSDELTKAIPYRSIITIETSNLPDRGWKSYSSLVDERIPPDRSHLIYKSGPKREFIRVGKAQYNKEMDRPWMRDPREAEGWIVTPASTPVFTDPRVEYKNLRSGGLREGNSAVLQVVSMPYSSGNLEKERVTYIYWFDEKGLLYKYESISFNGTNWVRRIETYEYDGNIKIEAPIED